jgi:hypothetical protein
MIPTMNKHYFPTEPNQIIIYIAVVQSFYFEADISLYMWLR